MPKLGDIKKGKKYQKYVWAACVDCGKERWVHLLRGSPESSRCNHCAHTMRWGTSNLATGKEKHRGRCLDTGGYVLVILRTDSPFFLMGQRSGYVLEHRLVMAQHLGRCLTYKEQVHHLNGIKTDNRFENLVLTTQKEHHARQTIPLEKRIKELEETIRNQAIRIRRIELRLLQKKEENHFITHNT